MASKDSRESPEILYPLWQREYEAALSEPESEVLQELVKDAEAAIFRRLAELAHDSNHHTERQVIDDALTSLRVLKNNFGFR